MGRQVTQSNTMKVVHVACISLLIVSAMATESGEFDSALPDEPNYDGCGSPPGIAPRESFKPKYVRTQSFKGEDHKLYRCTDKECEWKRTCDWEREAGAGARTFPTLIFAAENPVCPFCGGGSPLPPKTADFNDNKEVLEYILTQFKEEFQRKPANATQFSDFCTSNDCNFNIAECRAFLKGVTKRRLMQELTRH